MQAQQKEIYIVINRFPMKKSLDEGCFFRKRYNKDSWAIIEVHSPQPGSGKRLSTVLVQDGALAFKSSPRYYRVNESFNIAGIHRRRFRVVRNRRYGFALEVLKRG